MTLTKDDLLAIDGLIQKRIDPVAKDVTGLKKDVSTLKSDVKKIDKKVDMFFNVLDKDYLRVKNDVRVIQAHVHLPVSDF